MNKYVMTFGLLVFVAACIIASAGAMNYAVVTKAHIYTVGGILNLICGGYIAYRVFKAHFDEKYIPKK